MRKPIGVQEALVTPEQPNKGMSMRYFILLFGFLSLFAQSFSQEEVKLKELQETKQMKYDFTFSEGIKLKMLGNLVEAGKHFTKCTELMPQKPASLQNQELLPVQ